VYLVMRRGRSSVMLQHDGASQFGANHRDIHVAPIVFADKRTKADR
jgi:hypothetical protein